MAGSRPTVYDVAARAGVSIATVSFAFRHPAKVKESTRAAVEAAARELGYIPSASARGLAGGRTGALGLLTRAVRPAEPDPEIPAEAGVADPDADWRRFPLYFDEVQRGVEEECWRRGYAVMLAGATSANSEAVLTDLAGRVDGFAVLSDSVAEAALRRIAERLPVVVLSESRLSGDLPQIDVDNGGGIRALVEHLLDAHGLRELAFVGALIDTDRIARFAAFQEALRAARLPVPQEAVGVTGDHRAMVRDLLSQDALPEAFVCETDEVALALMDALRELGVDVPGQVAVTGFDGIVAGRIASPQLTTVRQPMAAIGVEAVKILIDRIERPLERPSSRSLPVQLVVRQSCGCPPG
ncbi:LacI family DNA-binding transcriptional regulator [Nocardioides dilutus]